MNELRQRANVLLERAAQLKKPLPAQGCGITDINTMWDAYGTYRRELLYQWLDVLDGAFLCAGRSVVEPSQIEAYRAQLAHVAKDQ